MAAIVALAGKIGTVTVNAVPVRLTRWTITISNNVYEYAVTGQTADADGQYWMNKLSGLNNATIEGDGYLDYQATAAARLTGDNIKFRPGTGAAGTFVLLFNTGYGFSGACVVKQIVPALDVEGSKPNTFKVSLEVDGALTYTNT